MKALLALSLLFLVGCGTEYSGSDPEIMRHVEKFQAAALARGYDASACTLSFAVVRSDFTGDEKGECDVNAVGISVSSELTSGFYAAFPNYAEFVVFHELGHCWLGLDHAEHGIMATGGAPLGWSVKKEKDLDALFQSAPANGCMKAI